MSTSRAVRHDAHDQRQAEQQVQGDRGADHLGEVAGGNRDLGQEPQQRATTGRE